MIPQSMQEKNANHIPPVVDKFGHDHRFGYRARLSVNLPQR